MPYHDLGDGVPDELRNGGKPLAVACSIGNRSSIAVSLLRRAGIGDVVHVAAGGVADLADEGIELVEAKQLRKAPLLHSAAQGGVAQLVRAAES